MVIDETVVVKFADEFSFPATSVPTAFNTCGPNTSGPTASDQLPEALAIV